MPTKFVTFTVNTMALTLLVLCPAWSGLSFAHEGGHGVAIAGKGPSGGKLAPVTRASEAELGAKAATQALAEWSVKGSVVTVRLWDKARKKPVEVKGSLKWILLGKELGKPLVVVEESKGQIVKDFGADFAKADAVEVILPNLGENAEKHVVAISLR